MADRIEVTPRRRHEELGLTIGAAATGLLAAGTVAAGLAVMLGLWR